MVDNIFCTVAHTEQAEQAISRMQQLGFRPEEVIVAKQVSELEQFIHTETDMKRSTQIGVAAGAVMGFTLGVGLLAYMGSAAWSFWGAVGLGLINAGCWGLVGSIVGCGGILAPARISPELARRFEAEVEHSKLLVAIPLRQKEKLREVRANLSEVGATNIYYAGKVA